MAIPHARPGEPVDVRPYGAELSSRQSHALFKSEQLEVMRLVLPAGRVVPPHDLSAEITIHCLEGRLEIESGGVPHRLEAGQLLYLAAGGERTLEALVDSSALMTVVLPGRSPRTG